MKYYLTKKAHNKHNKYYQQLLIRRIEIAMTFQPKVEWYDLTILDKEPGTNESVNEIKNIKSEKKQL